MLLLLAEEGLGNSDVTKKKEHTKITDTIKSKYASIVERGQYEKNDSSVIHL